MIKYNYLFLYLLLLTMDKRNNFIDLKEVENKLLSFFNDSLNSHFSLNFFSYIFITALNIDINDNNNNTFGLQKYYKMDKLNKLDSILKDLDFIRSDFLTQETIFENKIKIHETDLINNIEINNKFYLINPQDVSKINSLIISSETWQNIEPTQFPNIVKYSKCKKYLYKKNNISVVFKSYNYNQQKIDKNELYNCDIVIKKMPFTNLNYQDIKEIINLIKILFI